MLSNMYYMLSVIAILELNPGPIDNRTFVMDSFFDINGNTSI
jgi:hypothetical protein